MTMTERIRTRRAGRLATALTSGGLALAVIGVAAPASADPVTISFQLSTLAFFN